MNRLIQYSKLAILSILILSSIQQLNGQNIKGKGSDTMLPLMEELVKIYKARTTKSVDIIGGGSSLGFKGLTNYDIEFALSSRKVEENEKVKIEKKYDQLLENIIAYDALSIITHPSNKVTKLTIAQLKKVFKGEITNWKQLGGEDLQIVVISRDKNSGSYGFMESIILNDEAITNTCIVSRSNAGVVQRVGLERGAIGYCGIAYVEEIVKPLAICDRNNKYIYPSFKNALQKIYPLSRPLYLYYRKSDKLKVDYLINFALSDRGQQIIAHKGYIPVF
ncbi:phosphate ABC transporter substrate-binding protein [Flammeovirga kamogawensis]|uniref:Phosphate-binding protein n=1 Tax=Flammeovirga kamogawensis TaxID=373891 RepID=A0ABX8GXM8_9BACT|nr:phosphate ABC transporter substrate-binding protein [Flammeovirga kamogawensis]MBB6462854.1 phosphate transport system substrate-binding protein [Flammeovirga kamogawensis]QWG08364.1 phosphate ABC transporter substrate-binding protein [Flammeovirga kamogawensis]TRX66660.1 phosphate ABC transporter substrate-binding protein [Flammeovirga kamogawensis]